MKKIITIIIALLIGIISGCEKKEPIKKGDVMVWIDSANVFHPINDTITILDIKGNYCLYEKTYRDNKYEESDRVKWIERVYTKIK